MSLFSREFCFWMVGAKDGKVRKMRFSLRAILVGSIVCLLIASGFIFIASDYARVQIQRTLSHFQLKRLAEEKDRLLSLKRSLLGEVRDLKDAKQKSDSREEQIRARLSELAAILGSVGAPPSDPRAALGASSGADRDDGMGGSELDACRRGEADCAAESGSANSSATGLNPISLDAPFQVDVRRTADENLVLLLDYYISALKILPVGSPALGHVNSGFGYRVSPFHRGIRMHEGVDFSLPAGSSVFSTADGIVERVRYDATYGLMVDIIHSERVRTRYAHLSKAFVSEGEKICRGETIGLVGSSGRSTGPHLHYEVHVDGRARDPKRFVDLAARVNEFVESLV